MVEKQIYLTYPADNMGGVQKMIKRCFDVVLSLIGLIILSPVFLIFFLILKIQGDGGAIFKQERIGYNGNPFMIYKFRTLSPDHEADGPRLVPSFDEAESSGFCGFLRDSHLDELPQLWNVFIGDMSIVGPRPERQYYIDMIMKEDPGYLLIYQMKPGLTSEATLYNGYTDTMEKMLKRLRMDVNYLRSRTLTLDCQIVANTLVAMVSGKKF